MFHLLIFEGRTKPPFRLPVSNTTLGNDLLLYEIAIVITELPKGITLNNKVKESNFVVPVVRPRTPHKLLAVESLARG